jgi:hypothetical protein
MPINRILSLPSHTDTTQHTVLTQTEILCTKITAGDPLGWSEKSPALGLEPLTLGIQGQRLHHSPTEPLF